MYTRHPLKVKFLIHPEYDPEDDIAAIINAEEEPVECEGILFIDDINRIYEKEDHIIVETITDRYLLTEPSIEGLYTQISYYAEPK